MRKRLSELEQLLMDHVWTHPAATAEQCREALEAAARPLKESTVRTLLHRLEQKGYLQHTVEGRTYQYRASEPRQRVAAQAVRQIIDRLCGGSAEQLLVGLVDNRVVGRAELERAARRIAQKRAARGKEKR